MSEYWVSHKKYFCKYCNIYIADDKPSRTQHENGLKHKGNVERFVRGLYKDGQKRKQDLEEEKREMARVERAAAVAYAQDVGAGLVKPGSSGAPGPSSKPAEASKPPPKSADRFANYSTAQSLGYTDPDEERRKAEAEMRRVQGVVGDWEVVEVQESNPVADADDAAATGNVDNSTVPNEGSAQDQAPRKREAEAPLDEEDTRQFKLRRKKIGAGLGEIYDPGLIPIKLKAKKEEPAEALAKQEDKTPPVPSSSISTPPGTQTSAIPKWSARGWTKPGEEKSIPPDSATVEVQPSTESIASVPKVPAETPVSDAQGSKEELQNVVKDETEVKSELDAPAPPASGGLFRKRKVPVGGGGNRGRRS